MNKRKIILFTMLSALGFMKRQALFLFLMEVLSSGGLWILAGLLYFVWLFKGGKKAAFFLVIQILLCMLLWLTNAFFSPHYMQYDFSEKTIVNLTYELIELAEDNHTSQFDLQEILGNAPSVMNIRNGKVIALKYPRLLDKLNLSGVFLPFTGKCYINSNEKAFLLPFVCAHELSHRKGILNEGQANTEAFIKCLDSDKKEFRYSASVYALKFALAHLKMKNETEYLRLESMISENVRRDLNQMSVSDINTHCPFLNYSDLIPGLIYDQSITSQGEI